MFPILTILTTASSRKTSTVAKIEKVETRKKQKTPNKNPSENLTYMYLTVLYI